MTTAHRQDSARAGGGPAKLSIPRGDCLRVPTLPVLCLIDRESHPTCRCGVPRACHGPHCQPPGPGYYGDLTSRRSRATRCGCSQTSKYRLLSTSQALHLVPKHMAASLACMPWLPALRVHSVSLSPSPVLLSSQPSRIPHLLGFSSLGPCSKV